MEITICVHVFLVRMVKAHGLDTIVLFVLVPGNKQCHDTTVLSRHQQLFKLIFSGISWIGYVQKANDVHPVMECSNKGVCDRSSGACECFPNFEGIACERTVCLNDCNMSGVCYTAKQLAEDAGRLYETPWDADKNVGCVCDLGFRGPDCSLGKIYKD